MQKGRADCKPATKDPSTHLIVSCQYFQAFKAVPTGMRMGADSHVPQNLLRSHARNSASSLCCKARACIEVSCSVQHPSAILER